MACPVCYARPGAKYSATTLLSVLSNLNGRLLKGLLFIGYRVYTYYSYYTGIVNSK